MAWFIEIGDGSEWWSLPESLLAGFDSSEAAIAAADAFIVAELPGCDYGQAAGDTSVEITIVVFDDESGDTVTDERTYPIGDDETERALIAAAGGDPDCKHGWVQMGWGMQTAAGGFMVSRWRCAHCGVIKTCRDHVHGDRNPDATDTVTYSMEED